VTRLRDKLPIEPLGDARWERIERAVLDRPAEEAPVVTARRRWPSIAIGFAAAAAVGLAIWFLLPRDRAVRAPLATSGERAQIEFDGAELTIHPESVVSFREHEVVLESGGVDCRVAPRQAPFRVVAGEVTVSVVGTRFTVERRGQVRVRVEEGKVSVARGEEETLLAAGQSWEEPGPPPDAAVVVVVAAPDAGPSADELAKAEARARAKLMREAEDLRPQKPEEAAERYRKLARGSDRIAARALYDLAYIELFRLRRPAEAVAASRQYERRFPRGPEAADALWVRFEAYLDLNQREAARAAATEYVERFPKGDKLERALVIANR
jgi:hypothetical protein